MKDTMKRDYIEKRIIDFFSSRKWLLSFLLGSVSYYMFLSYSGMAGGKYSPIFGDSAEIYIPAIRQFCRDILSGQSVNYSWTNCFGMDTIAYNAYNVFSVTNILYLIFYNADIQIVTCISLAIKAGLAALFFEYYLEKVWKVNDSFCIIISICYALSAYQVCFNLVNFIWMDGCFVLPIIAYLLHNLEKTGIKKRLILSLAYLFICNFYIAYIIGLFSFIYFCVIILPIKQDRITKIKCLFSFALSTLVALAVDSAILLPTVVGVFNNRAKDTNVVLDFAMPVGAVINQLFFGQVQGWTYSGLPCVYCGVFVLFLVPLFFVLYKDSKKTLLGMGLLLLLLVASCYVRPLYLLWHGFDAPDGWNWRFSFLISFVLCVMAGLVINRIEQIKTWQYIFIITSLILYYVCYGFILRQETRFYDNNTILFAIINVSLLLIYAFLLVMQNSGNIRKRLPKISVLIGAVVVIELVANGYMVTHRHLEGNGFTFSEAYSSWIDQNDVALKNIEEDVFYRTRFIGGINNNADTMFGLNGTSDFFTVENPVLRDTLGKLGVATSAKVIEDFGYNYFTDMILGIKYKIYSESYDDFKSGDVFIYDKALGLGYLVDDDVLTCELDDMNDFANINKLSSSMAGYTLNIFDMDENGEISLYTNGIQYEYDGKHVFKADESDAANKLISLAVPYDGREAYIQFGLEESSAYMESPLLLNGEENIVGNKGLLSEVYIKKMDWTEYGNTVTILMNERSFKEAYIEDIFVAYLSDERLEELYDILKQNQLSISKIKDGYLKGNIIVKGDKTLFTTIPYEKGWKVIANGKEVNIIPVVNDTFIAIKLPEGEYELEFKYTNPYMIIGICISVLAVLGMIVFRKKL